MEPAARIGTSGWAYPRWKGPFYPAGLPERRRLEYYVARFNSVKINNSFYSLPSPRTLAGWRDSAPPHFVFTAKASRYISHIKKLKNASDTVPALIKRLDVLGDRLSPNFFKYPRNGALTKPGSAISSKHSIAVTVTLFNSVTRRG